MFAIGHRSDRTGNYAAGLYYLVVSTVIAGVAVLLQRQIPAIRPPSIRIIDPVTYDARALARKTTTSAYS